MLKSITKSFNAALNRTLFAWSQRDVDAGWPLRRLPWHEEGSQSLLVHHPLPAEGDDSDSHSLMTRTRTPEDP